ncbi:sialidase family protein [Nostoc sp. UHCC 0870]|uniref:sialidase family protein n=1 Tax=Nostoc sp. UHCC 0870 TaxID=2914041 RepID=UPI001EDEC2BC|nr:sialidase family protein [Nostoc sp. UHCC 0870]UKO99576.1 exo-alpha-sialidase [Nostoc sp. UHCC 0870]
MNIHHQLGLTLFTRKFKPLLLYGLTGLTLSILSSSTFTPVVCGQSIASSLFNWKSVNIQGMGYVTGLVISPLSPYDVYVRTDIGGIYRFDVQNNRWLPLMDMFDSNFSGGGIGVESIAVDYQNPQRVYAVVKRNNSSYQESKLTKYKFSGEVMVSNDRGASWQPTGLGARNIFVGPNQAYRHNTGERLAVDPNKSDVLYFASRRNGLWKKTSQTAWSQVFGGLPAASSLPKYQNSNGSDNPDIPGFTFVVFDKNSGASNNSSQKIYVGVHGSGVWSSTDGGKSWLNIVGSTNPLRAVVASDGTLYVSSGDSDTKTGSVRKYKNGVWTNITPHGTNRIYSSVTVQSDQPNTIMAISDRYVYRSTNGGSRWTKQTLYMGAYDANYPQDPVNCSAPPYYQSYSATGASVAVIDPSNPKRVWWTNGWGVARTDDVTVANPTYKWLMENLEELDANMVRVPPKPKALGGADLLSAVQDMIGFRHEDRNQVPTAHFNPVNIPINPAYQWANPKWTVYPMPFPHVAGATGLDYSYKNPDYAAFVGFHQWQGYWPVHGITQDNGKTWRGFASVPSEMLWKSDKSGQQLVMPSGGQIAMSPTNPQNMVWVPSWGTWPHYTTDGGKTWKLTYNVDHPPRPVPYDPQNNNHTHYQALPKAWANSISPWVSTYILASDRQDPEGKTFYYYDGWTFYYSKDGGANWRKGASGTLPTWKLRPTIVPNPTKMGDVWMSFARNPEEANGNKLYRSTDGGKTFTSIPSVDSCEFMTFGKGSSDAKPYIYIFGRVGGATKDTMYKSENMGQSWIKISNPNVLQFPGILHMEGDMRSPNLVYVSLTGRGIMVGEKNVTSTGQRK